MEDYRERAAKAERGLQFLMDSLPMRGLLKYQEAYNDIFAAIRDNVHLSELERIHAAARDADDEMIAWMKAHPGETTPKEMALRSDDTMVALFAFGRPYKPLDDDQADGVKR